MKRLLPILGMASFLVAVACAETVGPGAPVPDRLEPASPVAVLRNVELAFNNRDIGLFRTTLSPNFILFPDPRELGKLPPGGEYRIPEPWTYDGIIGNVSDLFETAYAIRMSIETEKVGRPDPEENTYRADNLKVTLIVKTDEVNGFIYEGNGNVEFEKYAAAGETYWRITKWWDRGGSYGEYPAPAALPPGTASGISK
jgi:hypothetical protein